ncbi:MAG TPA: OB-fold nucleic acid binding domain-containing protein [Candidatus Acidoferrum sp.]|nr:OB-fold nucleic acid binding domain-containing protein [Candidatus Acidoferrum sp.]
MESKKIKDFVVEDKVEGYFAVRKREVREFTRGQFVSLELGDSTGRIPAVMWDPDQFALTELDEGMVVKVRGAVTEYNNKLQVTVSKIRLATDDEYQLEAILPHSTQSDEQRQARILSLTEKVENAYIKSLLNLFWSDKSFLAQYLRAAAGKLWHHAYIGGLSEHSANVAELALRVAAGYDYLNKDYLIFGGLMHDAGKIRSYSSEIVIDFTDEGRLVDHIAVCDNWICERSKQVEGFPEKLLFKLRHLILSHQGERAFGSPVVPMIPEAFVLYYCDEIDSKMGAIDRIRQRQGGEGWSEYVKMLDRFLYFDEKGEQ